MVSAMKLMKPKDGRGVVAKSYPEKGKSGRFNKKTGSSSDKKGETPLGNPKLSSCSPTKSTGDTGHQSQQARDPERSKAILLATSMELGRGGKVPKVHTTPKRSLEPGLKENSVQICMEQGKPKST